MSKLIYLCKYLKEFVDYKTFMIGGYIVLTLPAILFWNAEALNARADLFLLVLNILYFSFVLFMKRGLSLKYITINLLYFCILYLCKGYTIALSCSALIAVQSSFYIIMSEFVHCKQGVWRLFYLYFVAEYSFISIFISYICNLEIYNYFTL